MSKKVSGLPTLQFTATALVKDIGTCVTMEFKMPGDLIYVLGKTTDELGASEYYAVMNCTGVNVPQIDPEAAMPLYRALYRTIQDGVVASCHALGRGGLGVHIGLCAMGGNLGASIDLGCVPADQELSNTKVLYSESAGRFVVTVNPKKREAFEASMEGLDYGCIGTVRDDDLFLVVGVDGKEIIKEEIADLRTSWKEPFGDLV